MTVDRQRSPEGAAATSTEGVAPTIQDHVTITLCSRASPRRAAAGRIEPARERIPAREAPAARSARSRYRHWQQMQT